MIGAVVWRAHIGPWLTAAGVALLAIAAAAAQTWVPVPFTMGRVPTRVLLVIAATTLSVLPLVPVVGILENTVPRARTMRLARAAGGLLLLVVPMWVVWALQVPWELWRPELALALLLLTGAVVSVTVLGTLAWVTPLAAGIAVVIVDHGPEQPVTAALSQIPLPVLVVAAAASIALFVWRGAPTQ